MDFSLVATESHEPEDDGAESETAEEPDQETKVEKPLYESVDSRRNEHVARSSWLLDEY